MCLFCHLFGKGMLAGPAEDTPQTERSCDPKLYSEPLKMSSYVILITPSLNL